MEFLVMFLEGVPFLLRIHLLHFLAEAEMVVFEKLEPIVEPLESFQHCHASLFPKHALYLRVVSPVGIFLLIVAIKLGMLVVANSHRSSLLEKLRVGVHLFFCVE